METKFVKYIIAMIKIGAFIAYGIYSFAWILSVYGLTDRSITIEEHCGYIGAVVGLIMMWLLFFQKIDNKSK